MTSGNNDKGRGRGNKGKDKVKNRVVSDDTPTQSLPPNATHVFRPQHPHFLSSGHTIMSPQYAPGITPSGRVFSSIPSQDDSSMPPPGYGYGYQHRSASGLHPSASPGYHIKTSRRPISSSRRSPSATPSPKVSPNISGFHLRDSSSSEPEPEPPSPPTPVGGGNPPIMVPGTDKEMHDRITTRPAGIGFDPSATSGITDAIQNLYDLPYPTWSDFPYDLRQTMLNEFKELKLGRKVPFGELFKKTRTKKRKPGEKGEPVWGEPRAANTHEACTRRMEEYIQSKDCNEQGEPYKPSDEEEIGIWLDVNGGVHKGRAYGLSSERSFHRLNSGLRGIGTSSDAEALDGHVGEYATEDSYA